LQDKKIQRSLTGVFNKTKLFECSDESMTQERRDACPHASLPVYILFPVRGDTHRGEGFRP